MSRSGGAARSRVLIVSASPSIIGGHSVQATALAAGLRQDGVDVETLAIDRPFPRGVRGLKPVRGIRTVVNEALYAAALRAVGRADVVHVFSASYWSFLLAPVPAMIAGRLCRRRVVLHYHSGEVADHLDNWGALVHPWLRLADEIVVCSGFQQAAFARHGHRSRVIPNVVDLERFRYRSRVPIAPTFVSTRNLESHYGVDVVLRAFAKIRQVHGAAQIVVAGRGAERERLERLAADLGPAGIRFVGAVSTADMPALLDSADIFLNGSTIDNQPVSILEAQASGLPVISTGIGGIPELVDHDRSGLLVPASDPEAMAAAALSLLKDPDKALGLARRARDAARRYTWAAVAGEWRDAYGLTDRLARAESPDGQPALPISTPGAHA